MGRSRACKLRFKPLTILLMTALSRYSVVVALRFVSSVFVRVLFNDVDLCHSDLIRCFARNVFHDCVYS